MPSAGTISISKSILIYIIGTVGAGHLQRLFQRGNAMNFPRRQFLHLAAGAAALPIASRVARAETYPTRPVRFIVPLAPGGGLDFSARVIGEYLSRTIGQQVYVENKIGAGGMIGIEAAAKSPPDGYTLLVTTDVVVSGPHVFNWNSDYAKDVLPVIELTRVPIVLAVHPSLGVNSIAELISVAKQRPGMGYATSGLGTQQHFTAAWFGQLAGIKLDHVPYRGAGQAINDLIAGHVLIAFLGPTALIPHYKVGTLRLLGQASETRSPSLPEVPTFQEAGVKGLVLDAWQGVFTPAGTPPAIVSRLNAEMKKALADPAVRESLLQSGQEPIGGSAEQFALLVRADSEKYGRLAKELNIKAN
jgi:tripartite-type tricarboxylate transporter receptor subunit TctC